MRRTRCSACGYDDLQMFLDLGLSPIADAYTATPDEPSETHPLQLAVCTGCWLVQLLEVVNPQILFGTGYSFYSSASAPLSRYHEKYAYRVMGLYPELARRLTVEIGCNDGDMLRHFAQHGCRTLGIDPAAGPVQVARDRGLDVDQEPFTEKKTDQLVGQYGHAGLVIANHVLAHVQDVADMLAGISRLLAADGIAMIEVQYLPDLLVNNAFDLVYHEHRNFFSLTSLAAAAGSWGLKMIDVELTDRQGGSLRVTLAHDGHPGPRVTHDGRDPGPRVESLLASETWLHDVSAYRGMQGRAQRIRSRLRELITAEHAAGRTVAGYGAPAKATTLLNFCRLGRLSIPFVTDTTAAKQGRYIPGTGIRIVPPNALPETVDTYLLLAWNYAPQVLRRDPPFYGRWILPIPMPVVIY